MTGGVCLVRYGCTNFGPVRSGPSQGHASFWKGCGCRSLSIQIWLQAKIRDQGRSTLKTHRLCRPGIQTDPDLTIQTCDQDLCPVVFKNILFSKVVAAKGPAWNQICFRVCWLCVFLKASGCSLFNALVLPSRWRQRMEVGHKLLYRWASLVYFAWRIIHKFVGPI